MQKKNRERLLTQAELAETLGLSVRTLQRMKQRGQLPPAVRVGTRGVRYRHSDVERFLKMLPGVAEEGGTRPTTGAGAVTTEGGDRE